MHHCRAIIGIGLLCAVALLAGCEGDVGLTGRKGTKGPPGEDGADVEVATLRSPRNFSLSIVNGSMRAIVASDRICLTSDSTIVPGPDTVVAARFSVPPLLDGIDGGEAEWGRNKSTVALHPVAVDPAGDSLPDPRITRAFLRVGFDDAYLYLQLQWREITVIDNAHGGTIHPVVFAGASTEDHPLYVDIGHPDTVVQSLDSKRLIDTLFTNLRIRELIRLDSICFPPPPLPPIVCDVYVDTVLETLLVWKSYPVTEDKVAIYWSPADDPALDQLPQTAYALTTTPFSQPAATSLIDVWRWGAATSEPTLTADDWSVTAGLLTPDAGDAPFRSNWILPDSVPLYMHALDPNHFVDGNTQRSPYPFWCYDACPYGWRGWSTFKTAYVAGIVTTFPERSRADISACARFGQDTWIVELKRARRTGHGDDLEF